MLHVITMIIYHKLKMSLFCHFEINIYINLFCSRFYPNRLTNARTLILSYTIDDLCGSTCLFLFPLEIQMVGLMSYPRSAQVDEGINESDYLSFTDIEQVTPTRIPPRAHTHTRYVPLQCCWSLPSAFSLVNYQSQFDLGHCFN